MIKYYSFVDVLALPQFHGMRERDLLRREMDEVIGKLLYPFGVDNTKPLSIQACRHRSNSKGIVTNYRYVAFERRDKEWLWFGKPSMEVRINDTKDSTLIGELSMLADMHRQSKDNVVEICEAMRAVAMSKAKKNMIAAAEHEPDMEQTIQEIKALQSLQIAIRGGPLCADDDVLWDLKNSDEVAKADAMQV